MKTLVAIVILLAVCLTGCKNKQEENNYTVSKTSYTNAEKNSINKYIENNVNNTVNKMETPQMDFIEKPAFQQFKGGVK